MNKDKLETRFIHAASHVDIEQKTGAVNVPIYLSSTFHQESFDKFGPFDYSRSGNPTRQALEQTIADLAVTRNAELGDELAFNQNSFGSILGAQDSYALIQGINTLSTRLKQSSESAEKIAIYLHDHPLIEEVFYPGLTFHPGHSIHVRQYKGSGAVLSFRLPNKETAKAFVEQLRLPIFAVSLGAVESILSYPATMSHAAMPKEEREKRGTTDGLFRLSVGLEYVDDLLADLDQALQVPA